MCVCVLCLYPELCIVCIVFVSQNWTWPGQPRGLFSPDRGLIMTVVVMAMPAKPVGASCCLWVGVVVS